MYSIRPGLILAFHGCDRTIVDDVLSGKTTLQASKNKYDWLGHGIYFWENSPARAFEYASFLKRNPSRSTSTIKNPSVLGAVISLGLCLDLLDYSNLQSLKVAYNYLEATYKGPSRKIPQNRNSGTDKDLLLRDLDCAVVETVHQLRAVGNFTPLDSVRGVFGEGKPLYPNAGFREKDHIQICIRNPNCIKGYFLPRKNDEKFSRV
jgi:hypothetical protein